MHEAVVEYADSDVLPNDELQHDAVLADAEFELLWRHRDGRDVREDLERIDELGASVS